MMTRVWYACAEPERPTDPFVRWHYDGEGCLGCRIKAVALSRQFPDDSHVAWVNSMVAADGTFEDRSKQTSCDDPVCPHCGGGSLKGTNQP